MRVVVAEIMKVVTAHTARMKTATPSMKWFFSRWVWNISQPSAPATTKPIHTDWSSYQKVKKGSGIAIRLLNHDAAACPSS
jgi:hypothetical protein